MEVVAPGVSRYVEVGANVGQWSLAFLPRLHANAAGLVFEPGRRMAAELRANLARFPQATVVDAACGDADGELMFYEGRVEDQMSGLVPAHTAATGITDSYPVRVIRLDDELDARGWAEVDFLKIDAEGYDLNVLRGADRLLAAQRVKVIQFEYSSGWPHAGATLAAAMGYLAGRGYRTFLLRPDGLAPVRYEYLGDHFQYANYVAVADRADWVGRLTGLLSS
jgi:FkbM family methyltransferase